uniref:(northern house mosquito) hypothetical protein n=1 Tax=Culex pipiens TaxID=7175 RepID=A0A8D7ZZL5_CULPI
MEVNFGKFFCADRFNWPHTVILCQSLWGKVASFLGYGMVANKHMVKRTMPTSKETQAFLMLSHSSTRDELRGAPDRRWWPQYCDHVGLVVCVKVVSQCSVKLYVR